MNCVDRQPSMSTRCVRRSHPSLKPSMKLLFLSIALLALTSAIQPKEVSAFVTSPRRHVTNTIGQPVLSLTIDQQRRRRRNAAANHSSLQKQKHQYYIFGAAAVNTKKLYTRQFEISAQKSPSNDDESSKELQEEEEEVENLNEQYDYTNHIPKTGYSLSDTLENSSPENKERFVTTLTPIITGIISTTNDNNMEEKVLEFQFAIHSKSRAKECSCIK